MTGLMTVLNGFNKKILIMKRDNTLAERIASLQDPVANPEIVTSVENAERQARDHQRAFHAAKYRLERFPLPRSSELRFAPARESGASHVWEP